MQGRHHDINVEDLGTNGEPIGVIYPNGVIADRVTPRTRRRRTRHAAVPFVMIEEGAATIAPLALSPTQHRIVHFLLAEFRETEQLSVVSQAEIGRELALDKSNLSRALKVLVKHRMVYRIGPKAWLVNPHYGFRGNTKLWAQMQKAYPEPDWDGLAGGKK